MTKIVIAGSRGFLDFKLMVKAIDRIITTRISDKEITIVSGRARGADLLGERYARLRDYLIEGHPAEWDRFGKAAGYIRNVEMGNEGDVLIAFWDMKSRGTLHMINLAKKYKLKIYVIDYNNRKIIENY